MRANATGKGILGGADLADIETLQEGLPAQSLAAYHKSPADQESGPP